MYWKVTSCANDRCEVIVWRVSGDLWTFSLEKTLLTDTHTDVCTWFWGGPRWASISCRFLICRESQSESPLLPLPFSAALLQVKGSSLYKHYSRGLAYESLGYQVSWHRLCFIFGPGALKPYEIQLSIPYMQEHFIEPFPSHFRVCTSASIERQ